MKIDEFIAEKNRLLNKFQEYWKENNIESPQNYPSEMNEEDWEENFIFFYDSENGNDYDSNDE